MQLRFVVTKKKNGVANDVDIPVDIQQIYS